MNKTLLFTALVALALVACGKKGSISGTIMDPFSGKSVEMPTVWIKGTTFTSQKIPGGLPDGKFKFEGIPLSDSAYTLQAGKPKYSQGQVKFMINKDNLDVVQNIFIYRQDVAPGLYRPIEGKEAEKIKANAIYQAVCRESVVGFRLKFTTENPNTKKKEENNLPPPANVPVDVAFLSKIATSVTSPIEVTSYPVLSESAKKHEDCGVDPKETLLVPNLSKGTSITSEYKSENLYEIKGTLLKGKQFLTIKQDGKLVNAYYLNAQ
ncbi:MAG: hypothetical protein LBC75_10420 [Fibromonadaceae bacterium]|jgi:hypothetical protein|nr:hypothetical protein [Fibromonadaceae bacterium]